MRASLVPDLQPVELLFSRYGRRVPSLLLLRPDESFYVREIGRLTGAPAGPIHRELKVLTGAGRLIRRASGDQALYQRHAIEPKVFVIGNAGELGRPTEDRAA